MILTTCGRLNHVPPPTSEKIYGHPNLWGLWMCSDLKIGSFQISVKTMSARSRGISRIFWARKKEPNLPTPWFWTFSHQSCRRVHICCLKSSGSWYFVTAVLRIGHNTQAFNKYCYESFRYYKLNRFSSCPHEVYGLVYINQIVHCESPRWLLSLCPCREGRNGVVVTSYP